MQSVWSRRPQYSAGHLLPWRKKAEGEGRQQEKRVGWIIKGVHTKSDTSQPWEIPGNINKLCRKWYRNWNRRNQIILRRRHKTARGQFGLWNFEIHIQQICFKAGNHLNVLKRLSTFKNCEDRMAIFRSFILCHFEFCSVVWHFCEKPSIQRMEKNTGESHTLCVRRLWYNIPWSPTQCQTADPGTGQGEEHCYSHLQNSPWSSTELLEWSDKLQ